MKKTLLTNGIYNTIALRLFDTESDQILKVRIGQLVAEIHQCLFFVNKHFKVHNGH